MGSAGLYKVILVFGLFWWACAMLMAQDQGPNLVPNAGFESLLQPSDGHLDLDSVAHWFNPHWGGKAYPFGTPDCMTSLPGNHTDTRFRPYEGQNVAGIITYLGRIYNFREYITVRLDSPLTIGQDYEVAFQLSNGTPRTFGAIGANGLGFALTTYPPKQRSYEPLLLKPHFELQKVFYQKTWRGIGARLEADSAYQYLTIGNFRTDRQTILRYFRQDDADPQAYYFIDKVSVRWKRKPPKPVVPIPSPPPAPTPVAKAPPQPKSNKPQRISPPPPPPASLRGRPIYRQGRVSLMGNDSILTVKIWDAKDVDGDLVSIKLNGQWILKDYMLRKKREKFRIKLAPGSANYLILFAQSLGTNPPCTASFQFKSKTVNKKMTIKSDLGKCGAVEIIMHE